MHAITTSKIIKNLFISADRKEFQFIRDEINKLLETAELDKVEKHAVHTTIYNQDEFHLNLIKESEIPF